MRTLHLFAGAGGSHYAGMLAGWQSGFGSVEIDPWRRRELSKNFPDEPLHDDVRTYDGRIVKGKVDLVVGGSPCQDVSRSGLRKGLLGDRSKLVANQLIITRACDAPFMFWENVDGVHDKSVDAFNSVLAAIHDELGMHTAAINLSADHIGAPHERKRVWVLAWKPGMASALRPWAGAFPGGAEGLKVSPEELSWGRSMIDSSASILAKTWGDQWPALRGKWPARPNTPQHKWEPPHWVPYLNSAYLSALGDAWVPTCAAVAWMILCGRAVHGRSNPASQPRWQTPTKSDGPDIRGTEHQNSNWKILRFDVAGGDKLYNTEHWINPLFYAGLMGWPLIKRDVFQRGKLKIPAEET